MSTASLPVQIPTTVSEEAWEEAGSLQCLISVDLPLRRLTVGDLLALSAGDILETKTPDGADVPVTVNSQLIGWAEFEIVGQKLAIRVTELG
jgi:flagellar motor switch/type III secretory pathway protein FliN